MNMKDYHRMTFEQKRAYALSRLRRAPLVLAQCQRCGIQLERGELDAHRASPGRCPGYPIIKASKPSEASAKERGPAEATDLKVARNASQGVL